jgi:hypothetical protein
MRFLLILFVAASDNTCHLIVSYSPSNHLLCDHSSQLSSAAHYGRPVHSADDLAGTTNMDPPAISSMQTATFRV